MVRAGLWQIAAGWVDYASFLRDCRGGGKSRRLLFVFSGCLQVGAAHRAAPARIRYRSGADAKTSLGPGCTTPCSVAVPAANAGFSVTFTKDKFLPATVQVQVVNVPGDFSTPASTSIDPNPVVSELKPAGPPPKPARKPRKPKPPKTAAAPAAAAPADAGSVFPTPHASARTSAHPVIACPAADAFADCGRAATCLH